MHPHHLREFWIFIKWKFDVWTGEINWKYSYHERFYKNDYFIAVRDKNFYK